MKQQQKVFLLAIWLFALPLQLWAQDKKPFFNLKKGDWFMYQVNINSDIQVSLSSSKPDVYTSLLGDQFKHQYNLRFVFTSQKANGNQQFDIFLERVKYKLRASSDGIYLGYDSFYPTYSQAPKQEAPIFSYKLEISPSGEIVTILPDEPEFRITLEEISPKMTLGTYTIMSVDPLPDVILKLLTDFITIPHTADTLKEFSSPDGVNQKIKVVSVTETPLNLLAEVVLNEEQKLTIPFSREKMLPALIKLPGSSMVLTDASFPVPANTLVKGRILNLDSSEENVVTVNNKEFKVSEDGTFSCPLLIEDPREDFFRYSGKGPTFFHTFLTPGDTLTVEADATNFQQSLELSGSAAPNCRLAMEAQNIFEKQDPNNFSSHLKSDYTEDLVRYQESGKREFDKLMSTYSGKVSTVALDYFKTEWDFLLAEAKLYFLYANNYRSNPTAELALQGLPQDFFLDIDTLPVVMNDFVGGRHYNNFFEWFLPFQEARVSRASGGRIGFLSRYSIALASLKQYPLYKLLAEELEEEIGKNTWEQNQRVKPYFEDYIANCRDTSFTNPLVKLWQRNESWAPGKNIPVKTLTLADGSTLNLTKFKGKALCLVINYHETKKFEFLLKHIKEANPDDVHFLIAQINRPNFEHPPIDTAYQYLPHITHVKLHPDYKESEAFGVDMFESSIFVFDKWLRVIENNLRLHRGVEHWIDEPIKKAIKAKKYSKIEKAEMLKIGGWSLGSTLFVVIIGTFIYRIRLRSIRQQELVKRQMQELEIKAIRSQMNPHFVFNALNSIQSLINGSQFKEANIYLARFSTLLRSVLNNSEKSMVPLSNELEAVTLYCQLEQLRFDFAFELLLDEAINPNLIEIPPMVIQPLVENAIVHGLAPKGNEGVLQIEISIVQGQLQVVVTDNGTGLTSKKSDKLSKKGFGLKLVQERINILNHEDRKTSLTLQRAPAGEAKKTISQLTIPID